MACPLFSLFDQGNHVSKKGSIAVCYDAMSEKHLTETTFASFNLDEKIQKSLDEAGYTHCTPIQQKCIPIAIKGRDVAGQAQTGTGKTAAFMVATLQYLHDHPPPDKRKPNQPRVLVVAPTRELAIQIHKDALLLGKYCGHHMRVVVLGIGVIGAFMHIGGTT